MKKKPPMKVVRPPEANVPPDHVNDQRNSTLKEISSMSQLNTYAKYSNFMENTVGIGRNGKRAVNGGVVAGGTWAAGHYGGVEVINNNLPTALAVGAAVGFLGTVAMDHMLLDAEQEALLLAERYSASGKEVQDKVSELLVRARSKAV